MPQTLWGEGIPMQKYGDVDQPRQKRKCVKVAAAGGNSRQRLYQKQVLGASSEDEDPNEKTFEIKPTDTLALKIEQVLDKRSLTEERWSRIQTNMQTKHITNGSIFLQEFASSQDERFLIKWDGLSYLHVSWETREDLMAEIEGAEKKLNKFSKVWEAESLGSGEMPHTWGLHSDVERIVDIREVAAVASTGTAAKKLFMIKWCGLPYNMCTWESPEDIADPQTHSDLYHLHNEPEAVFAPPIVDEGVNRMSYASGYEHMTESPPFKNGGKMRSYQVDSLNWMLFNWLQRRNSLLADEMGLGKTLQTVAYVQQLFNRGWIDKPVLVLAPLSTLEHWRREFTGWTDLNTIVYHGDKNSLQVILKQEFFRTPSKTAKAKAKANAAATAASAAAVQQQGGGGGSGGDSSAAVAAEDDGGVMTADGRMKRTARKSSVRQGPAGSPAIGGGGGGGGGASAAPGAYGAPPVLDPYHPTPADPGQAARVAREKQKEQEAAAAAAAKAKDSNNKNRHDYKIQVVITSYEMLLQDAGVGPGRKAEKAQEADDFSDGDMDSDTDESNSDEGARYRAPRKRGRPAQASAKKYKAIGKKKQMPLLTVPWSLLVVDEAQRLKNSQSKLSQLLDGSGKTNKAETAEKAIAGGAVAMAAAAQAGVNLTAYMASDRLVPVKVKASDRIQTNGRLRFNDCLMLTGTPIQNRPEELWSLLRVLSPEKWGRLDSFQRDYGQLDEVRGCAARSAPMRPLPCTGGAVLAVRQELCCKLCA
jgi:hypothetical protein